MSRCVFALRLIGIILCVAALVTSLDVLHDCDTTPIPLCHWSSSELHAHLATSIDASINAAILREDIDGAAALTLTDDEMNYVTNGDSDELRKAIANIVRAQTQSATATACDDVLATVPADQLQILRLLTAAHEQLSEFRRKRTARAHNAVVTENGSQPALVRTVRSIITSDHPYTIAVFTEDTIGFTAIVSHISPLSLLVYFDANGRRETATAVAAKLSEWSKRFKNALKKKSKRVLAPRTVDMIHVRLSRDISLCAMAAAGFKPDVVWLNRNMFPLPKLPSALRKTSCECASWTSNSIVAGVTPTSADLHALSLASGYRVYVDLPIFILTNAASPLRCRDSLGSDLVAASQRPLLALYMIVKNEAGGIQDTMDSIMPYLDRISVLDTGSTDGTDKLISGAMTRYNVSGRIHRGEFVDFSTTRNDALRLASEERAMFILMLNGDDTFINGDDLRGFLSERVYACGPSDEMYLMSVDYDGHKVAWSERAMRSTNHEADDWIDVTKHWHYTGLTHEVYTNVPLAEGHNGSYAMVYAGRAVSAEDNRYRFHIHHTYVRDDRQKLMRRGAQDVKLLKRQLETKPNDERTLYYIAHSYDIQEDFVNAYLWHQKRVERLMEEYRRNPSNPPEADREACTSLLRLGKIKAFRLGADSDWNEAKQHLLHARALCQTQIESRYFLAEAMWRVGTDPAIEQTRDGESARTEALMYAREATALVADGRGLIHVLENETVHSALPRLMAHMQNYQQTTDKPKTTTKTRTKKRVKDEL